MRLAGRRLMAETASVPSRENTREGAQVIVKPSDRDEPRATVAAGIGRDDDGGLPLETVAGVHEVEAMPLRLREEVGDALRFIPNHVSAVVRVTGAS